MEDLPTLLILGQGEPMRAALEEALERHATFAEEGDETNLVAAVTVTAPDVVVLVGDAVRNHESVLRSLSSSPMTSAVPVILLAPADLGLKLSAARRGVALVERTASVDEMAKQVARLTRELIERPSQTGGSVGHATLPELLEIVKRQLESGILSVSQEGGSGRSAHFVLEPGRNVEAAVRRTPEMGAGMGTSESWSAAEAPHSARTSGSCS